MYLKRTVLGLVLLTACQASGPKVTANDGFSPQQVASAETANGSTPMFVTTATGSQILSWVTEANDSAPGTLVFRIQPLRGGASLTSILRDPLGGIEPHGEAPPQIAAGPGNSIYALYLVGKDVGQRYPAGALRFSRSDDGGMTWSAPVSVNEGEAFGSHNFHGLSAGPDGSVYATWLSNTGKAAVWLRASTDGGRTWDKARVVSTGEACPCCRTAVSIAGDGTLYLAWRDVAAGDVRDIVVATSKDHGATWSTPVKPRVDGWVFPGCPHAGPSMKVDPQGNVHIAWWTGKEGEAGIWYARSTDHGATWKATAVDTAMKASPMHVQLVTGADGAVVVSWDGGKGTTPQVLVRASGNNGELFGPTKVLSDPAQAATFPVIALLGDSITVAWTQVADSAYRKLLEHEKEPEGEHEHMALPRVGQREIFLRKGSVSSLIKP